VKVCMNCGQGFEADDWRCTRCGKSPKLHKGCLTFLLNLPGKNDGFNPEYYVDTIWE